MVRSHTHWPQDLIDRLFVNAPPAPICDLPTRKACDQRWTEHQHGHPGQPCVRRIMESKTRPGRENKRPTCVLQRFGADAEVPEATPDPEGDGLSFWDLVVPEG